MAEPFTSAPRMIYYISFDIDKTVSNTMIQIAKYLAEPSGDFLNHDKGYYVESIELANNGELDYIRLTMGTVVK